ncbi:MAG: GTP 3',8-cyclase MoaA [Desulfobulbaceae bacterium]|uniref:GTP 3',8-cyclase n=1 Tax=Candidatus Desulfatifera sulfidica TaxID=2841691 RepID=A0A8J6N8S6_9BACT|nr:GTP 3',8-cyclase MoaA [Candidatus Desulfatifera sulfidica]
MQSAVSTISPDLVDQFSRTISYLRVSLTDRCNLRCRYCMPQGVDNDVEGLPQIDLLSYDELLRIIRIAVTMGMNKLRLTGGEPLVRPGVMDFIDGLSGLSGLNDIRLTTNGVLLADKVDVLYEAGIRKLNISLDSLKPERFAEITGVDCFAQVWQGIEAACERGFQVKLNAVAMRGVNDDELEDFARLAGKMQLQVRFIEFMPMGERSSWEKERFISAEELQNRLALIGKLERVAGSRIDGPARIYNLIMDDGRSGKVGFISPISHHFCDRCNRLRLTSEGRLRSCLLHDRETDLKGLLRLGGSDLEISAAIRQTILNKPKGHTLEEDLAVTRRGGCHGRMSRIGG